MNPMTVIEAKTILTEYNKWHRGLPPYDGETPETYRGCPHTPKDIGIAIDTLTEWVDDILDGNAIIVDKDRLAKHDEVRLDNAVEWMRQHVNDYLYNIGGDDEYIPTCGDMLFIDFRKAMNNEL